MIPFLAGCIVGAFSVIATLFLWLSGQATRLSRLNNDNQQAFEPDVVTRGEG